MTPLTATEPSLRWADPTNPGVWCIAVKLPHGIVAWAIYRGMENLGHGTLDDTLDNALAHARRHLPRKRP